MELFQLYATLGLKDTEFSKGIKNEQSAFGKLTTGIGNVVKAVGGIKAISAAFDMVTSSVDSAVKRYDTLTRLPKMMQQMGYSADEFIVTKIKELCNNKILKNQFIKVIIGMEPTGHYWKPFANYSHST